MKKILIFGVSEKTHTILRIIDECKKAELPFKLFKWSSLSFRDNKIYSQKKLIDTSLFSAVFFDVPSYYAFSVHKKKNKIAFDLDNELIVLLGHLKKKNVFAINREALLEYPYYNKFTQAFTFSDKKIKTIPTLHLVDNKPEKVLATLKNNDFKFPIVVKESNGGLGEQVWKAKSKNELEKIIAKKRNTNLIYQPFLKNQGDFRVLVIGGKSLGIMKRVAQKNEWRNNFALGGKIIPYFDKKMEKFAEDACKKMNLQYAGVDVFKSGGKYLVIEVNIFARFEGFERTYPQKNVAGEIVKLLKKK
jgi:RimK family alpha-L-glutamate ligase